MFGFTCLVFKTTYIDRGKPLQEGAFFFTRRTLFSPLNKRNTRDKAKGVRITSEGHNRVNRFCHPDWALLGNRTACEVVIGGGRTKAIVVCAQTSSGLRSERIVV